MPRTPNPQEVRSQLEQMLSQLRNNPDSRSVRLPNGKMLAYDPGFLLSGEGSLGAVSRLMLMRCKLGISAKELLIKYKRACEQAGYQHTNYTALQYAFSLTTTQLKTLPPHASLTNGMASILNEWRQQHGNGGLGLPAHPESTQLFSKPFVGDDACERFLEYLEFNQSPATQLASGRRLNRSGDRGLSLGRVVEHAVNGDAMLINVHADVHWDGLRAFSEAAAYEIAEAEAIRALSLNRPESHLQREVLYVPLRANARPVHTDLPGTDNVVADEHMGLDRLMGILTTFTQHGSAADVINAPPMEDEIGFTQTLHKIRESLMQTARIFVFDGVYDAGVAPSRQALERVISDEHFLFLLKRLMEPLLASTYEAYSLDVFNRNRFIVTSNSENLGQVIWSVSLNSAGQSSSAPPIEEPLRKTDAADYQSMLKHSVQYADQVINVLRQPVLNLCRNDVANQFISSSVALVSHLSNPATIEFSDDQLSVAADALAAFIKPPASGLPDVGIVSSALLGFLLYQSKSVSLDESGADKVNVARLWAELFLMLSVSPEGLTIETIDRALMRLTMTPSEIEHPLPALQKAKDLGCLDVQIAGFAKYTKSIAGFIRREFVEGPEVEDHPLEYWEGLPEQSVYRQRNKDLTLDFRYPEIRSSLQQSVFWDTFNIDRFLLHRVYSEIALQYQTTYFRHTDYRHRGSVRNWRRLITALYHGLASIGPPEISTHKQYSVRGADAEGTSQQYWLFLYAKLYRQVMEGPGLWRISRIMGLDDLKIAILELFSKPWLLHSQLDNADSRKFPRFIDHFDSGAQPAAEYYLTRMRSALGRGEVEKAKAGWYDRFQKITPAPSALDRLRMEHALLEKRLQTVESTTFKHVIEVLNDLTGAGDIFSTLERIAYDPDVDQGLVNELPTIGHNDNAEIPGLLSLVDQEGVSDLIEQLIVIVGSPSTAAKALNYYGTLSRFESDRADFSQGYRQLRRAPIGLTANIRAQLENTMTLNQPERRALRRLALARLLLIESARVALFRLDPTGAGFNRSNAQGRTAVRLAIKLDDEYRQQLTLTQSVPSAYYRFARRLADSCTRMAWQFPRDQSNALVIEASMLRSESKRITAARVLGDADVELALRLLSAARATIGRSERVLATPNVVSRARLRMMLERYKLNRDVARLHNRCQSRDFASIFSQHAQHDLGMLRGAVETNDARPYWKLIVALQHNLPNTT